MPSITIRQGEAVFDVVYPLGCSVEVCKQTITVRKTGVSILAGIAGSRRPIMFAIPDPGKPAIVSTSPDSTGFSA